MGCDRLGRREGRVYAGDVAELGAEVDGGRRPGLTSDERAKLKELLDTGRWRTRVELANAIFEYIEVFHNRRRRHSSLGMLTPIEFELNTSTPQTQAAWSLPPE